MDKEKEFEFRYRYEQEMAQKPGVMDVLPQMLKEASTMGIAPNMANQLAGDIAGEEKISGSKDFMAPEEGLQDVSIPDTLAALGVASPLLKGAGKVAKTGAEYAGEFGEKQMGKLHGMTRAMFKQSSKGQLENPRFSEAMRDSYAEGDANLLKGQIGRKKAIQDRMDTFGGELEDLRHEGSVAGPVRTADSMADEIQKPLGGKFQPGGELFDQQSEFERQLDNIRKMQNTAPADFAQRASAINRAESKGIAQPKNVETAIANQMSRINNADLATRLGPEKAAREALVRKKFGNAKSLVPGEISAEGKELSEKLPDTIPGMVKGVVKTLIGGPRMGAQLGFGTETALEGMSNAANWGSKFGSPAVGGITAHLMSVLSTNPQSLGKYASPLMKAAQEGGNQGLAATHYILSTTHPDYNQMVSNREENPQ